MAKDNSDRGYDRIVGAMTNPGHRLSDQGGLSRRWRNATVFSEN